MRTRRALAVLVGAGAALFGTVGCSAGNSSPGAERSLGSASTVTTPAATTGPQVPAAAIAALLIPHSSAIVVGGVPISTIEDDGGVSQAGGLTTQARLRAKSGDVLTLMLSTLSDGASARQTYDSLGLAGAAPVRGIADRAEANGSAFAVLEGDQVLSVQAVLGPAGVAAETRAKLQGKTPPAFLYTRLATESSRVGRAAAMRLTNAHVDTSPITEGYVPPMGVDPCTAPVSDLTSAGVSVTRQRVQSDRPPALECVYEFAGAQAPIPNLTVYTLTALQAVTAVQPTTPDKFFEAIRSSYIGGDSSFVSGTIADPIRTQARTTPDEPDYSLDVDNAFTMDMTPVGGQKEVPKNCQPFGTVTGDLAKILAPRLRYELDKYTGETKEPNPDSDPNELEDWLNLWRRELDQDLGPQVQQAPQAAEDFVSQLDKAQRNAAKPWTCEQWNSILRLSR